MSKTVTVITGASSGIGAAQALQLGSKSHQLVLAARREKELRKIAGQTGTEASSVVTDVTRRRDVERLKDVAVEKFGHVDVWVSNAGRGMSKTVLELTEKEFDDVIAAVLKSVWYGMQTIIPHFQERGNGHLINISSFRGRVPLISYRSIYSAAKSAVNVLTANLRMDLKMNHPGIHVSLVMPGIVDTSVHTIAETPVAMRAEGQAGPMRIQSAEEVASQIVSLIDHPVAEFYTNPSSAELVQQYYRDVGQFEENMVQRAHTS